LSGFTSLVHTKLSLFTGNKERTLQYNIYEEVGGANNPKAPQGGKI
jgi:hypothetical protein